MGIPVTMLPVTCTLFGNGSMRGSKAAMSGGSWTTAITVVWLAVMILSWTVVWSVATTRRPRPLGSRVRRSFGSVDGLAALLAVNTLWSMTVPSVVVRLSLNPPRSRQLILESDT